MESKQFVRLKVCAQLPFPGGAMTAASVFTLTATKSGPPEIPMLLLAWIINIDNNLTSTARVKRCFADAPIAPLSSMRFDCSHAVH
jgi:hypothetical protein